MGTLAVLAAISAIITLYLFMAAGAILLALKLYRDHKDASKYRALLVEYEKVKAAGTAAPKTGYRLVYKVGRKQLEVTLPGSTEAEALVAAAKQNLSWSAIVSLDKL